ncbi:MAG: HAD family hydrolase [Rhodopirellula sp.]|nr:HAD family hydrolase [Rhodopirellula sp.]
MPSDFKAVIFDLDGTLLDTLADIGGAANEVLAQRGHSTHTLEAYRHFIGDGVATLFQRILPDGLPTPDVIADCVAEFAISYGRKWNENSQLYPGISDLLDELVRRGIPIAILSNKPHDFVGVCVSEFLSKWNFDPILGQRDNVPRKPDPAGVLEVCQALEVAPDECLYVGDSSVDMLTARNSGALAVGVAWGFRPVEELVEYGAARILDTPAQLLELFGPLS